MAPIQKNVALVGAQLDAQSVLRGIHGAPQILQPGEGVAIPENDRGIATQTQTILQSLLAQLSRMLVCVGCRPVDGPFCRGIAVVVEYQAALVSPAVGVREDIFVPASVVVEEVIEQEVAALGKDRSMWHQGS